MLPAQHFNEWPLPQNERDNILCHSVIGREQAASLHKICALPTPHTETCPVAQGPRASYRSWYRQTASPPHLSRPLWVPLLLMVVQWRSGNCGCMAAVTWCWCLPPGTAPGQRVLVACGSWAPHPGIPGLPSRQPAQPCRLLLPSFYLQPLLGSSWKVLGALEWLFSGSHFYKLGW